MTEWPNEGRFPVGGPRQPVYDFLRSLGFSMAPGLGDKHWISADKLEVHIYGAGSMARVSKKGEQWISEVELNKLAEHLDALRTEDT